MSSSVSSVVNLLLVCLGYRTGSSYVFRNGCELREVLRKQIRQFLCLLIVGLFVRPGVSGLQHFVRNARTSSRDQHLEYWIGREFGLFELAVQRGADNCSRVADLHAFADSIG